MPHADVMRHEWCNHPLSMLAWVKERCGNVCKHLRTPIMHRPTADGGGYPAAEPHSTGAAVRALQGGRVGCARHWALQYRSSSRYFRLAAGSRWLIVDQL